MSTSAPAAILAQDTNAHFQAWVSEVVTALFTTLGVTQTSDTGQINPATVTIPGGANTSAGYVIGRFNDTLQSTAPIFFKLEFGTAAAVADPQMWITVGTSSNGSGTIGSGGGGAVSTRCTALTGGVAASISTAYTSRYVYLGTTQCGLLGLMFKYGAVGGVTTNTIGGFFIFRSSDSSGNATASSIGILAITTGAFNPGSASSNGCEQMISFANSALIPTTPATGWEAVTPAQNWILGLTTTLVSSTGYLAPIYIVDPVPKFSAYLASALSADFGIGTTASITLIGATPMTFISSGQPFGATAFNNGPTTRTLVVPWQ